MNEVIAVVVDIQGDCFAQGANGELTSLVEGSQISQGETLITYQNSQITLNFGEDQITIPENQIIEITPNLSTAAIIERLESQVAESSIEETFSWLEQLAEQNENSSEETIQPQQNETTNDQEIDDFLTALAGDGDILSELEATAAGGQAEGGGGVSFVRLLRIAQTTEPLNFEFNADSTQDSALQQNFANDSDGITDIQIEDLSFNIDPLGDLNNPSPTITGTSSADAGSQVSITVTGSDGQTQVLTTEVDDEGNWSVDADTDLPEGTFSVDGSIESNNGNVATNNGDTETGTIDTTSPILTVNDLGIVNDQTPLISGTSDAGAGSLVTVVVNDDTGASQQLTAEVDEDGNWLIEVGELPEGSFDYTVSVSDPAGNITQVTGNGEVDTTSPTLTVNDLGIVNDQTPIINGTSDAGAGSLVTVVVNDDAGASQQLTAEVDEDGNWSIEVGELPEGSFDYTVSVSDPAGNITQVTGNGEIDTTSPTLTVNDLGIVNDQTPIINGTSDAGAGSLVTVVVNDDAGASQQLTAEVDEDGNWSIEVGELPEGSFDYTVSVSDPAGNITQVTGNGEVDTTSPILTVNDLGIVNDQTPIINGTSDAGAGSLVTVVVNDDTGASQQLTAEVDEDGNWSIEVGELPEGSFDYTVSVSDPAGNITQVTGNGEVDTTSPILIVNDLGIVNDQTPIISGASDGGAGSLVTVVVNDDTGASQQLTAEVDEDGNWSIEVGELPEGSFDYTVSVSDPAGNITQVTGNGEVDTTSPVVTINVIGVVNDATPLIIGTSDTGAGSLIDVTVVDALGVEQNITTEVQADNSWQIEVGSELNEGEFSVSASASDLAGNQGSALQNGTLSLGAPELTINEIPVTNDLTPIVSGTSDAGQGTGINIEVTDGAGNIQNVTVEVDDNGNWSVEIADELSEGEFTVEVDVTENGVTTTLSETGEIDVTPPVVSIDDLGSINDQQPTLTGNSNLPPASLITIVLTDSQGNEQTLSAEVDQQGFWQVEVPAAISEGEFLVSLSATDNAGNTGTAQAQGEIDLTAPELSVSELGTINNNQPVISGTSNAAVGSEIQISVTDSDGQTQNLEALVTGDGSWSAQLPTAVADGDVEISAQLSDAAGNQTSDSINLTVDTQAPGISINPLSESNDNTPQISGISDEAQGSEISVTITDVNGDSQTQTAIVDEDGNWSIEAAQALAEGSYSVNASVSDSAGNTGTAQAQGEIDLTAPELSVSELGTINNNQPIISGTSNAAVGSEIQISVTDSDGQTQNLEALVTGDGSWSAQLPTAVADGDVEISAQLSDAAGNQTSDSINLTVDTQAPGISINPLSESNDNTPQISGISDEAQGSEISVTITDVNGDSQTQTAIVDEDGNWTITTAELVDGDFTVTASATDAAGNQTQISATGTIDTLAPTIEINPIGQIVNTQPTITGSSNVAPGSDVSITVTDSAGVIQTEIVQVQNDGSWSVEPDNALAEGDFEVSASVSDSAGNEGTDSESGNLNSSGVELNINALDSTNDTTPTISGSTSASQSTDVVVIVVDSGNTSQTITAQVDENGNWSVDVLDELAEGEYEVTAQIESNGVVSEANENGQIDTTAPEFSINALADTNDTTPTIKGSSNLNAGDIINLNIVDSQGDTQQLEITIGQQGHWQVSIPTELPDGEFTVTGSVTDAAGNTTTAMQTGLIDTVAPELSIEPIGQTNDATPVISGGSNLAAGSIVTVSITDEAGISQTLTTAVDDNGQWQVESGDLIDGRFNVIATAEDVAGNQSSAEESGTLDTQAYSLTINESAFSQDTTPIISGQSDAVAGTPVQIEVVDSNGVTQNFEAQVAENGSWIAIVPNELSEGEFTISASVTDDAGNESTANAVTFLDSVEPSLTIDSLSVSNDTTPLISGKSDEPEGSQVKLTITDALGNEQVLVANVAEDGSWQAELENELSEGDYQIVASIEDAAGNLTTAQAQGEIDTTAPIITIDTLGETNDITPILSGTSNILNGSLDVTLTDESGNISTFSVNTNAQGDWQQESPAALSDGEFSVSVQGADSAGNETIESAVGNIDTQAPSLSINELGILSDTTPIISGSSDLPADSSVNIVITDSNGDKQTLQTSIDENGDWQAEAATALSDGQFEVLVSVEDAAGNVTSIGSEGEIDTVLPIIDITSSLIVNDSTPLIFGSSNAGENQTVTLVIVDAGENTTTQTTQIDSQGQWQLELEQAIAEGEFNVQVTTQDQAGNQASASDSGLLDTIAPELTLNLNDLSNDATPSINGTSNQIGAEVVINIIDEAGNEQQLTAQVDDDGNWQVESGALVDGEFNVSASITDTANNTTQVTDSGTIDTVAYQLSLTPLGVVNDTTPSISGESNAPVNTLIEITVSDANGQEQSFTAQTNENGDWSTDVPNEMAEGIFTVEASVTDLAGNQTSAEQTANLDSTAPSISIQAIGETNDSTPVIQGTSSVANGTVNVVINPVDGDNQIFSVTTNSDGSWDVQTVSTLAEGNFEVSASITDNGKTSEISIDATIDTTAPDIAISELTDTKDSTPVILGTANEPAGTQVELTVTDHLGNNQNFVAIVGNSGGWSASVPNEIAEGDFSVTAAITDSAGNNSTADAIGTLDLTAPEVSLNDVGIVNDTTPVISGSSDLTSGNRINLVITDALNNEYSVQTSVDSNGDWSVTLTDILAEGQFDISVTAIDTAGNATTVQGSGEVDISGPEIEIDELNRINDTTPLISGQSDLAAGEKIDIEIIDADNVSHNLEAQVDSNGNWSVVTNDALAEGEFSIIASATDEAGNLGSATATAELDITPPTLTIDTVNTTSDVTPEISGMSNATAGSQVSVTIEDNNGNVQQLTANVSNDGSWSAEAQTPLAEGDFSITASVSDDVGNKATAMSASNIDTQAPSLVINDIGEINDTTPLLSGTSDEPADTVINLTINPGSDDEQILQTTVKADGSWQVLVEDELAEGSFEVLASVADPAGNTTRVSVNGVVDTTPPEIRIDEVGVVKDTTPVISGVSSAGVGQIVNITVLANGITQTLVADVKADNTWSVEVPTALAEGEFSVSATVADQAGNTASDDMTGEIDTTAPSLTIESTGAENDNTPTISGTSDAVENTVVKLEIIDADGNQQILEAAVDAEGNWQAEAEVELVDGTFSVNASISDLAGNTESANAMGNIDTTPPLLTLDLDANLDTINAILTNLLSGTTEPGADVTIRVGNNGGELVEISIATADENGNFGLNLDADLLTTEGIAEGDLVIEASVSDAAGNKTVVDIDAILDITPPDLTLDPLGDVINSVLTQTLTGSTEAGASVTIKAGVVGNELVEIGVATADEDGDFILDIDADLLTGEGISEGTLVIEASVSDAAGNEKVVDIDAILDITPPNLTLDPLGDVINSVLTQTLTGSTEAGASITIKAGSNTSELVSLGIATADENGDFTLDIDADLLTGNAIDEGDLVIQASVADAAGNEKLVDIDAVLDITPPNLTLDPLGDVINSVLTQTLTGSTEAGASVTIKAGVVGNELVEIGVATADDDGNFILDIDADLLTGEGISEGTLVIEASVSDAAGNEKVVDINAGLDITPPNLTLDPLGDVINSVLTQTLTGSTEAGASVTIKAGVVGNELVEIGVATADDDGDFILDIDADLLTGEGISEGTLVIEASVSDAAGNEKVVDINAGLDITPPDLTLDPLGDVINSVLTQTLTGSTEAGASVTIKAGVVGNELVEIGVATADDDGDFILDIDADLLTGEGISEGTLVIEASVSDAAGNEKVVDINAGLDITPPDLTLDPLGDVINSVLTQTLTGSTEAGASVTIKAGVVGNELVEIGVATADDDGDFILDIDADLLTGEGISEGTLVIEASVSDAAGNEKVVDINAGLDITPPDLTLDPLGNLLESVLTQTLTGNTEEGAKVDVRVGNSGSELIGLGVDVTADENGDFSIPIEAGVLTGKGIAEGDLVVEVTVTDESGNQKILDLDTVLDLTLPELTLDPLGNLLESVLTQTLTGNTEAGAKVDVRVGNSGSELIGLGVDVTADENGDFSIPIEAGVLTGKGIAEGDLVVEVTVTDESGNQKILDLDTVLDLTLPELTLDPLGNLLESVLTQTLTGNTEAGAKVDVRVGNSGSELIGLGVDVTADENGDFSIPIEAGVLTGKGIAEGDLVVEVTVTDESGNQKILDLDTVLDLTLPELTLSPLASVISSTLSPALIGETEAGATVNVAVKIGGVTETTLTTTADGNGNFNLALNAGLLSGIDDGDITLEASVSDTNGNTNTASVGANLDVTAPILNVDGLVDGSLTGVISTVLSPALSGSTEANANITLSVNVLGALSEVTTLQADANGDFSIDLTAGLFENITNLDDGDISLQLAVEDEAENKTTLDIGADLNIIPPALEITSVEVIDLIVLKSTTISGTSDAEEGAELTVSVELLSALTVELGTALVQSDGSWTITNLNVLNIANITISMKDGDGNLATLTVDADDVGSAARPMLASRGFAEDDLLSNDDSIEINYADEVVQTSGNEVASLTFEDLLADNTDDILGSDGTSPSEQQIASLNTTPSESVSTSVNNADEEIMRTMSDSKLDI